MLKDGLILLKVCALCYLLAQIYESSLKPRSFPWLRRAFPRSALRSTPSYDEGTLKVSHWEVVTENSTQYGYMLARIAR